MKLSHFFIDRPIFAIVVSIVTVLLGVLAYTTLPVASDRASHPAMSDARKAGLAGSLP